MIILIEIAQDDRFEANLEVGQVETLPLGGLQEAEVVVMVTLRMTMTVMRITREMGQEIILPGRNCCSDVKFAMRQDTEEAIVCALFGKNIVCFVKPTHTITKSAI